MVLKSRILIALVSAVALFAQSNRMFDVRSDSHLTDGTLGTTYYVDSQLSVGGNGAIDIRNDTHDTLIYGNVLRNIHTKNDDTNYIINIYPHSNTVLFFNNIIYNPSPNPATATATPNPATATPTPTPNPATATATPTPNPANGYGYANL